MTKPIIDYFTESHAKQYDEVNRKVSFITDDLHHLTSLVLEGVPKNAKILSIGAGTGAEIFSLAKEFPSWSFVAVEPSLSMLDVCREKAESAGIYDRCEFVHGFAEDLPEKFGDFDVVLVFLVAHFVTQKDRLTFFKSITKHLRKGGYLVNAEISFDLDSKEFSSMFSNWKALQKLRGASEESLKGLRKQLKEVITVLPSNEIENVLRQAEISLPIKFYQALMISAWYGIK